MGWFGHRLSRKREADARAHAAKAATKERKVNFLVFLRGWRIEIARNNPIITANHFTAQVRVFEEAAERVTNDYPTRFEELVEGVSRLRAGEIDSEKGKRNLIEAIDAVRDFAKAN